MDEQQLFKVYQQIKTRIEQRVEEFEQLGRRGREEEFLTELIFCLLTPQSRAPYCWDAACNIRSLPCGGHNEKAVLSCLPRVRFKYTKAKRVVRAFQHLKENNISLPGTLKSFSDSREARCWVVETFSGLGWKEGSHFLRNTGIGLDLAIIDRHVLRMLVRMEVLDNLPSTINYRVYLTIEDQIRRIAQQLHIPVAHLDLLFWYLQTNTIFK